MTKRITAMTVRKNLGEVLEGVFYNGDEVVVERAGKPMGVIVPLAQYEHITKLRVEAIKTLETIWDSMPSHPNPDAAEEDVLTEVMAVRHNTV
jgi:prevent-host-death family protein